MNCPTCQSTVLGSSPDGTLLCRACGFRFAKNLPSGPGEARQAVETTSGPRGDAGEPDGPPEIAGHQILQRLGKRGVSEVYLALQENLQRKVVLKVLAHDVSGDQDLVDRFDSAIHAAAQFEHPSIVWILSRGRTVDGRLYFSMEHVDGQSLRTAVDESLFDVPERIRIVLEVVETLAQAHSRGFFHGDLRPENVLVKKISTKLQVKILDFVLAAVLREFEGRFRHRRGGSLLGEPHYRAPEQRWNVLLVSPQTEVYSLGIVFYELLVGSTPAGLARPPGQLNPEVPAAVDRVIAR
ncbi:MAG: serine/threonine protein kinase, partial [Candidatus Riflebacteria bacterium]|nr:serine/threonine protein kinase [Candidatus Riflebacteria bacterium]